MKELPRWKKGTILAMWLVVALKGSTILGILAFAASAAIICYKATEKEEELS